MLHPLLSLALLMSIAGPLCAGSPQAQPEPYRQDVFALCGKGMDGRGTGTPGGEAAIAYLVTRMEALGLRPFGGSFRGDFEVDDPRRGFLPATACTLRIDGAEFALAAGEQFAPFRFSRDGEVEAEVVFAGHGIVCAEAGIDDYAGLDATGRAVLVLRGGPDWRTRPFPAMARELLTFATKARTAAGQGAVAMLLVDRADPGVAEAAVATALRAVGDGQLPAAWLSRRAAAALFAAGAAGLAAAQEQLDGREPPAGIRVALAPGARVHLRVAMGPKLRTANVVGLWRGSDRELAGEFVVVGAHHDHIGRGEYASLAGGDAARQVHPGADDNASGVAGLLELARRCVARGPLRRSVVFAAFGAEELGQLGSQEFLRCGAVPAGSIAAMIDLDMIGRGRSGAPTWLGVDSGTGLRELVEQQGQRLHLHAVLRGSGSSRSDMDAFLARRIPSLWFTTGLQAHYHRPDDVPELIEFEAARRWLEVVDGVLQQLANGDRPGFTAGTGK